MTPASVSDSSDEERREIHIGVRYFNYRGFTNRTRNDGWDHTIECLMNRLNPQEDTLKISKQRDSNLSKPAEYIPSAKLVIAETPNGIGENRHLFRIRIRSAEILRHLSELSNSKLSDWRSDGQFPKDELVFCRPFHVLVFYHQGMKERLGKMQSDQDTGCAQDDSTALREMKLYVAFAEERILPLWTQFDEPSKTTPKKVSYEEIPFLFRPGELAFAPSSQNTTKVHQQSAIQTIFRMYFCLPLDVWYEYEGEKERDSRSGSKTTWSLYCLDSDGEGLRTAWRTVSLDYFKGERDITSLRCFPLKFHPERDRILQQHVERGREFKDVVQQGVRHLYYSGWNLVTGILEEDDPKIDDPEYVESEVIIDIKEAQRHIPEWVIRDVPEITSNGSRWSFGYTTCSIWNRDGSYHDVVQSNILLREDATYFQEAKQFYEKNPCFQKDGKIVKNMQWRDEDFALLPKRIPGYVLRERKFTRLDVQRLQSKADSNKVTLDDIQIKQGHKKIIRSSVSSHFLRSVQKKSDAPAQAYDPDIIKGKGRGLVILLHGAPGVGKTATAEAVALEFNKPLFPITCGDLGITSDAVDKNLKKIFRYAYLWDCILLLDEAEVFLTQRDRSNIERNALVSVFLRVLEYYSGILFLTTNRVGALDEAIRSRVHISLYYPRLRIEDTEAILRSNLKRLPRADMLPEGKTPGSDHIQVMDGEIIEFIKAEYHEHHKTHQRGPWNGREIRNAVQIATSIAFHDHSLEQNPNSKNLPAVLTSKHFKIVHETMIEFDHYMTKTQRADESKMAQMEGVRYDGYGQDSGYLELTEYEGFAGPANNTRSSNKYPAERGSRGRVAPGPTTRQPSSGRYATAAPPAIFSRGGQAPHPMSLQSYDECHLEEEHAPAGRNPHGGPFGTTDPFVRGERRPPQSRRDILMDDPEDIRYHKHTEQPSEWPDENERNDDQTIPSLPLRGHARG
ncbi:hypothetical protein BDV28DRAFT_158618 [Aspergillus coremiiformis]|uniref:AAA+ ATPase domain-containing protein n=1 Tax=Aspergillus coremiiformis TaxID=138285 RepID=A0A5N6Z6B5_9EURO|nr:hypothetical protein BDV28DRAFT_158618 [Aspergillus coremiiformis]